MPSPSLTLQTPMVVQFPKSYTVDEVVIERQLLEKQLDQNPNLTIDLSQTKLLDSACLSMLVVLRRRAQEAGGILLLRSPSKEVLAMLNHTNLLNTFWIEASPGKIREARP